MKVDYINTLIGHTKKSINNTVISVLHQLIDVETMLLDHLPIRGCGSPSHRLPIRNHDKAEPMQAHT